MAANTGEKIKIVYSSPSTGKHPVNGMATKTQYGYRKKGDVFFVYEADIRLRPDLFRPVDPLPERMPTVGLRGKRSASATQRPPAPQPQQQPAAPSRPPQSMPSPPIEIEGKEEFFAAPPVAGTKVGGFVRHEDKPPDPGSYTIALVNWEGKLNAGQIKNLSEHNINTLRQARAKGEEGLLAIKGVGPAIAKLLLERPDITDQK